jgi:O-succinylbenzoic acid--CoA ligase
VNELVCLDMPCGPQMVDRIRRAWDEGDAIFPLDQRLPAPARTMMMDAVRPTKVATLDNETHIPGTFVETGDAVVVATSGTTGRPKAVVLTLDAVIASAQATSQRLSVTSSDKWLACLPPSHVGGLSVILRSLVTETPLIAVPAFSVEAYDAAAREGATLVSLVSTALQRVDSSKFRTIVLGGARPPQDRPTNTVTTYGMTETGSGIVYDGTPLANVEIEIRDSIIHVKAPMLMRAYRDGESPLTHDGWLRTGDIGTFENGRLVVEGREGDLIITGGENVWPEDVEAAIRTSSLVTDVCVAGVPDHEWGQLVTAWIVPGDDTPSLDDIRSHVKETLPAHCAPRRLEVVSEIPRTSLGKPKRAELIRSLN